MLPLLLPPLQITAEQPDLGGHIGDTKPPSSEAAESHKEPTCLEFSDLGSLAEQQHPLWVCHEPPTPSCLWLHPSSAFILHILTLLAPQAACTQTAGGAGITAPHTQQQPSPLFLKDGQQRNP